MNLSDLPILSAIIFTPLIGCVVLAFVPGANVRLIKQVALATSLIALALSLIAAAGFGSVPADHIRDGFSYYESVPWIPFFGIRYELGMDGISLLLVVLTTLLTSVSIVFSFGPIKTRVKEYMISFLALEIGMLGVFLALDLFLFYIFWELVLVPMYLIIGIWGGPNRIYATIKFVLYTLAGSLLMLVAILATAFSFQAANGGDWTGAFDLLALRQADFDSTHSARLLRGVLPGVSPSRSDVPFHTWSPGRARRGAHGGIGLSSRACCSRWAAMGSSASRCPSTRRRHTTSRASSWSCRSSRSSTARSSPWSSRTSRS